MAISLMCSFFLSAVIVQTATVTQQQIWRKYINEEEYIKAENERDNNYEISIPRTSQSAMNSRDAHISELCDFLETYTVLILSILSSCIAVVLFYRNKLKEPIEELHRASQMIAEDELEFHISYVNKDELGQLCNEFERMRAQLEQNNKTVWRSIEDEKALRAAIAHDIRSPLSVLKGYQEMLLEFVPNETIDKEKISEMLQEGMRQIERMNSFIETIRKMTKLEERELHFTDTNIATLGTQIQNEVQMLAKDSGKFYIVQMDKEERSVCIDIDLILEVVENLFSNALRYARENVKIVVSADINEMLITVMDDGNGFQEDWDTVTKAFFHSNPQDSLQHFGMGMYISRIYCERHGGKLLTGNNEQGGALVKATFKLNK